MVTPPLDAERDRTRTRPRQPRQGSTGSAIDRTKRVLAAVLGVGLLVRGVRRRSLRGTATALAGGWLLYRALGGNGRGARTSGFEEGDVNGDGRGEDRSSPAGPTEVTRSVTVGGPAEELYEAWRDPETFSRIMGHFAEVTSTDGDRFRWTVRGPRGVELAWETHVVESEPGEFVRWETPEDATLPNEGTVRFRPAPGDRGTIVTLSIRFDPPGGALGDAALQRLDVVPKALAGRALGRFKSLVETGEIPTVSGNPSARGRGDLL